MPAILAHPFRVVGSRIATVEEGSEAAAQQAIAVLATTRRGERPLAPGFGVTDPVFDSVDVAEINAGLQLFGPAGVLITGVDVDWLDTATQRAVLAFEMEDLPGGFA